MAGGRPSKYQTHVEPKLLLIAAWCRNGLKDVDICNNLGIGKDAFIEYKKQYSELADILKQNKEVIDTQVENALLKSALGYQYTETTHEAIKFGEEQTDAKLVKTVLKEVAPNTTALIFWLKNRNQKDWKDKQEVEHSGTVEYTIKPPPLP